MNKRQIGKEYETRTIQYMKGQGMEILERNYHCRQGEVDIVARENSYLLFVEVKYRKDLQKGYPAEAVTPAKQKRIRQVAWYYLYEHHMPEETPVRFDVAAILGKEMQYIRDAF